MPIVARSCSMCGLTWFRTKRCSVSVFFLLFCSGGGGGEVTAAGRAWGGLVGDGGRSCGCRRRNVWRVLRQEAALYEPRAWQDPARGSCLCTDACESTCNFRLFPRRQLEESRRRNRPPLILLFCVVNSTIVVFTCFFFFFFPLIIEPPRSSSHCTTPGPCVTRSSQTRVLQLEEVCHTQMTRIQELESQVRDPRPSGEAS